MMMGSIRLEMPATMSSTSASKKSAAFPSMWSIEPDSSPIEHICSTMDGNRFALVIATVNAVPVETSCCILTVARVNTELPAAPPTESSASTSGTPAANMVESVRVHRAIHDFSTNAPNIGSFSITRSITLCIFSLRFQASMKK